MRRENFFTRIKDKLVCFGIIILDGMRDLLPAPRKTETRDYGARPRMVFPLADWRSEALNDFAYWLKEIDAADFRAPALNISHDFFEVLTEVSSFRQEVKRQNREQSKMTEELSRMEGLYREALGHVAIKADDLAGLRRDVQHEAEKAVFLLFADLRDALQRGADEIQLASQQRSLFRKLPPAWKEVQQGYEIALSRFDRAMTQLGIRKVLTCGQRFDSRLMVAVATRYQAGVEAGVVLEESMSGYVRGEEVLRAAQVVVATEALEE